MSTQAVNDTTIDSLSCEPIRKYLQTLGIRCHKAIIYNPSFETLREAEVDPNLRGFERAEETDLGALNVDTGSFTGRSPKDKYFVYVEHT